MSSKYLDLTRRKLEITRLPHEKADPKSNDWWEPKPQVEPLIDFWSVISFLTHEGTFTNHTSGLSSTHGGTMRHISMTLFPSFAQAYLYHRHRHQAGFTLFTRAHLTPTLSLYS